ncbi:MAG: hypothetical protein UY04_C0015G0013 [Parcubacteria group bacterium GW2011_GWA2_47_7]|nr:MAG: hypothetical protein UY04_C0015G0013 [Parcubacteria group bacterium GW2011_GWA2_47_7]HCM68731.1 hypothetical protein [Candidatus Kerfeldbacteria bacterium]
MEHIKKIQKRVEQATRMSTRFLFAFVILVLGVIAAFSISVQTSTAGPGQPFGGMISAVFTCTCSGNFAIYFTDLTISPPIALPLIYQPGGTITYQFGPPLSAGRWMLGTWTSGGSCRYWVGKFCSVLPTAGTMYMVGTSM